MRNGLIQKKEEKENRKTIKYEVYPKVDLDLLVFNIN